MLSTTSRIRDKAAIVEQEDGRIHLQHKIGGEDECRRYQEYFGDQKGQRADWDKDLEQTNHLGPGVRTAVRLIILGIMGHPNQIAIT